MLKICNNISDLYHHQFKEDFGKKTTADLEGEDLRTKHYRHICTQGVRLKKRRITERPAR